MDRHVLTDFDEDQLRELVSLVGSDHRSLSGIQLEPDGRFQSQRASYASFAERVVESLRHTLSQSDPDSLPYLYYACGRARGGSTSLTNVFGIAGIPSYYQPVKSSLRHVVSGIEPAPWPIGAPAKFAFAKETFGPYTLAECLFQPIDMLIEAGYPVDKIHLILFDREPASALASWLARWSDRVPERRLVFHFVLAGINAHRVAERAKRRGVATTTYVYELSKEPAYAVGRLFERLGIPSLFNEAVVSGWADRGDLASARSSIIFPSEPPVYNVPGLHGADVAYRFHARQEAQFPARYTTLLEDLRVMDDYRRSVQSCIRQLDVDAVRAQRIFGLPT